MSIFKRINDLSNNEKARKAWFSLVCLIFLILIIVPSIFVVLKMFTEWGIVSEVFRDAGMISTIKEALWNSFSIAGIVTVIDVLVGIPMAWIFVRKQFKGKKYLDTLMDMPLAFPTAVLGISVVMFWGAPEGIDIPGLGLSISPYVMLILLHIIFTYPYMVRSLSAILEQIEPNYETAAMTLSASRFTALRTITLPLFRAGLVTGTILCFARSLSETGGTYIALQMMGVESTFFTGPTFIAYMKEFGVDAAMGPMILISVLMIVLALLLLVVVKLLIMKFKIPVKRVWPNFGRLISRGTVPKLKDAFSIAFLAVIVLLPTFYIFTYLTQPMAAIDYGMLLYSTGISFLIAGVAVIFDIVFGIPIALYIARKRDTKFGKILDSLVNVPLIIPTTALGFSLALFWGSIYAGGSLSLLMVILGHIAFTFPLVVRNITGAVEEVDVSYEEVAMTLGAKPFQAFSKVLMPIIKSSIIAGAILAFTRSLGETGATVAISNSVKTVPVYIMDLIKVDNYSEAAFCSIILIAICFVFMFFVRVIINRGGRHA
ncbi:MAG: ABC transporter permease subunit [Candidatus Methanoplasma sp.]|jgi:thiamine transport system permease protein|nr:ABC transporter permease subunit [Candidatus Methanoplasma sp.]